MMTLAARPALALGVFLLGATVHGRAAWDTFSDTWVATDGLSRALPAYDEAGPVKTNRAVGMFYFLFDHYPQRFGWHESASVAEELPVCVAQHPTSNIGRSFNGGAEPPPGSRDPVIGLCFAEQWSRALSVGAEMTFVTGWNEWIAQRFTSGLDGSPSFLGAPTTNGQSFFVDAYNQEFSRDIEPMAGGHGDNYYYQLVANVRRLKGLRPIEPVRSWPITAAMACRHRDVPASDSHVGGPARHVERGHQRARVVQQRLAGDDAGVRRGQPVLSVAGAQRIGRPRLRAENRQADAAGAAPFQSGVSVIGAIEQEDFLSRPTAAGS